MATATQQKTKAKVKQEPASTIFKWEGTDKKGNKVKGETTAASMAIVRATLRKQGINAKKVRKKPKDLFSASVKKNNSYGYRYLFKATGNNDEGRRSPRPIL